MLQRNKKLLIFARKKGTNLMFPLLFCLNLLFHINKLVFCIVKLILQKCQFL